MVIGTAWIKAFRGLLYNFGDVTKRIHPVKLPYPVWGIYRRDTKTDRPPVGGGPETFEQPAYIEIDDARKTHLASLGLPLERKRVLDVGCGVGNLSHFFLDRSCEVVCVDARHENISSLRLRYPGIKAHVINVETESLSGLGTFDIVFAYGLLYHLENPMAALRNMETVCQGLLLLETMVCDHNLPVMKIEDESFAFSQALGGLGCRPSPSYVTLALNRIGFPFIYAPKSPPKHPDFQFKWRNNLDTRREGHHLRCIFIASKHELIIPSLIDLLSSST